VVIIAAVLTILGFEFGPQARWGDVATWVLAATTFLAFVAAGAAALVAYRLLVVENQRDAAAATERKARLDAEKRAQAEKIAAWYGTWRLKGGFASPTGTGIVIDPPVWGATLRNASDLPVYDVRISFCIAGDPSLGLDWRSGQRYSPPDGLSVLPPGEQKEQIDEDIRQHEEAAGACRGG
jgi:hypothetical protein